jgi:hypothetical protein
MVMKMRRRLSSRRLALLAAAVSVMVAVAGEALAIVPITGTTPAGATTVVNQSNGPQRDPHVSGSLVSYTDQAPFPSRIQVFDLGTNTDTTIPGISGEHDFLSDVSGTNVVFTRIFSARSAIMRYDAANGTSSELDPQPASDRTGAAIGGQTVAWMDLAFAGTSGQPEIVAFDLGGGGSTRLTNDAVLDTEPAVSPGGDVIVWTRCTDSGGIRLRHPQGGSVGIDLDRERNPAPRGGGAARHRRDDHRLRLGPWRRAGHPLAAFVGWLRAADHARRVAAEPEREPWLGRIRAPRAGADAHPAELGHRAVRRGDEHALPADEYHAGRVP